MKTLVSVAGFALLIYLALCLLMYLMQRRLMYFPVPETTLPGVESMQLPVDGAKLKIWTLNTDARQAIIYFGGNAEDVAGNIPAFSEAFSGSALYLVNYRGYGGSSGRPTETALLGDALRLYDHIAGRHARIAVIGRSLGSGVAVHLAAQRPVSRLVLVTPFDSIAAVAQTHYPLMPVAPFIRDRYNSARRAAAVNAPTLIVIAEHDEIIPRARSQALIDSFRDKPVQVTEIVGANHNTLDEYTQYLHALQDFLQGADAG